MQPPRGSIMLPPTGPSNGFAKLAYLFAEQFQVAVGISEVAGPFLKLGLIEYNGYAISDASYCVFEPLILRG